MPKPVCQHQDRHSKASRVVRGPQNSGCPMRRHLCHLIKTNRRAPEVAKCPAEAGHAPGTDQSPGWTPESTFFCGVGASALHLSQHAGNLVAVFSNDRDYSVILHSRNLGREKLPASTQRPGSRRCQQEQVFT